MRLLNRGHISEDPHHSLIDETLSIFGWDSRAKVLPNLTKPTAALDDIPYTSSLYRADPVHLRADGMQLRLFSGKHVAPEKDEADKLLHELNEQFPEYEFLCGQDPSRWYIRFPQALDFIAQTPFQMHQQIIDDELPTGRDAKKVHGLMNEFQMLMHNSAVNQRREMNGKPVLNSLWVWGSGDDLTIDADTRLRIYGADFLALALAKEAGVENLAQPSDLQGIDRLSEACHKVVFLNSPSNSLSDRDNDIDLGKFELRWCESLVKCLRRGSLKRLSIVDNYRRFDITNKDVWKMWRRTSYFSDRLSIEIDPQKIPTDVSLHDTVN